MIFIYIFPFLFSFFLKVAYLLVEPRDGIKSAFQRGRAVALMMDGGDAAKYRAFDIRTLPPAGT